MGAAQSSSGQGSPSWAAAAAERLPGSKFRIMSPAHGHGEAEEEADAGEDKMPIIMERCAKTAECKPLKRRWDRCAERLGDGEEHLDHHGHPETCAEEMFDAMNCMNACAKNKIFRVLK